MIRWLPEEKDRRPTKILALSFQLRFQLINSLWRVTLYNRIQCISWARICSVYKRLLAKQKEYILMKKIQLTIACRLFHDQIMLTIWKTLRTKVFKSTQARGVKDWRFMLVGSSPSRASLIMDITFSWGTEGGLLKIQIRDMTQCKIEFTYQSQNPPNFKVVLGW